MPDRIRQNFCARKFYHKTAKNSPFVICQTSGGFGSARPCPTAPWHFSVSFWIFIVVDLFNIHPLSQTIQSQGKYSQVVDRFCDCIGGSRGGATGAPPQQDPILLFCMHFFWKVPTLEVGAPQRLGAPHNGNPGSTPGLCSVTSNVILLHIIF